MQREFVDQGMVADLNVHWDIDANGLAKPHAHVMLSMREVDESGFGKKVQRLKQWRERWADHVNERLAALDIDARIDHRSFEQQGIGLEPQHKIGPVGARRLDRGEDAERAEDHRRIARENGDRIIARPQIAIDATTHSQATFTNRDLAAFVHRHSDGKEQFDRALGAIRASPELVPLGKDGQGRERFTSRDMIAVEARLEHAAGELSSARHHRVTDANRTAALAAAERRGLALSGEQRDAFEHVTGKEGLASVVGYAGSGKSAMLEVAREAWEAEGYTVRGAALSGIAAENLESGSGIAARTLASLEHQWEQGRDRLTSCDVLVIDEAGMIGSRQMEQVLSAAKDAGAKVVLVGDPEQLQAIVAVRRRTPRSGAAPPSASASRTAASGCRNAAPSPAYSSSVRRRSRRPSANLMTSAHGLSRRISERHIKPRLGRLAVADVTRADVERFMHEIAEGKTAATIKTRKRGLARVTGGKGTATRTVGLVGAIFTYAVRQARAASIGRHAHGRCKRSSSSARGAPYCLLSVSIVSFAPA